MKIIVVEDEIRIREGIAKLVGKLNKDYEVVGEAENGQSGLELIREMKPDIIITDIRMPIMDGLEMLQQLHREGIAVKAIVLSAYSEFEYARQAMSLGVTEYLLKPLTLTDFSQALQNVRFQLEKEQIKQPNQLGTKEQVFRELLYSTLKVEPELETYLMNQYGCKSESPFVLLCDYLGETYSQEHREAEKALRYLWLQKPDISYCVVGLEHYKAVVMILYNITDIHALERWFQIQILSGHIKGCFGWASVDSLDQLAQGFRELYPYMDWNITLENEILISYPKVNQIQAKPCIYPIELENQVRAAVCIYDWQKMTRTLRDFHQYFSGGIFVPREIKECYVRFFWTIIAVAKELACLNEEQFQQERLLELVMKAKSRGELLQAADVLLSWMKQPGSDSDSGVNQNIKRALRMINEFYQSGITLEEIAARLNLTPEYLGTQFHREMGTTFSTYMREFRMNKAKELLCATSLRIYEIAEKVGYTNPKYFSQVFKEYTGVLPAEYRKMYK